MEYLFFVIVLVVILLWVWVTFFFGGKRKKLSSSRISYYENEIRKCESSSASERIMKYDKILHHILKEYGYDGTVGDQLKAKPSVIDDLNMIWELHKVRNRLAHEMDAIPNDILEKKSREFAKELRQLLK